MTVFEPDSGTLTARLFEDKADGVAVSLVYDIVIPVRCALELPPDLDADSMRHTDVRLDFIRIGLVDWRDLPGRTFTFPVNPVARSVYFDGAHQYADLTRVHFGALTEGGSGRSRHHHISILPELGAATLAATPHSRLGCPVERPRCRSRSRHCRGACHTGRALM